MIKTTSTKINICCIAARYYVTLIFIWNHVVTILFLIYALISFDCKTFNNSWNFLSFYVLLVLQ